MKRIKLIFLLFLMAAAIRAFGQQEIVTIPKEKLDDIDRYKELVVRYKLANNPHHAAFYLNKIAFIYWEFGNLKEDINYFLENIPLNERLETITTLKLFIATWPLFTLTWISSILPMRTFSKGLKPADNLIIREKLPLV